MLAGGGSGEERGDFKPPPSFGECAEAASSCRVSSYGAAGAIFRFFVEAVVEAGGPTVEPKQLQGQAEGSGREDARGCAGGLRPACSGARQADGVSVRRLQWARRARGRCG